MKLHFTYSSSEYYGNYKNIISIYNPLDKNINISIIDNKTTIKSIIAIVMNNSIDEEEKSELSKLYVNLVKAKKDLINDFENLEISNINDELLSKINNLISNVKIPIIINLTNIDKEYIISNISKIECIFKENGIDDITYKIKYPKNETKEDTLLFKNSDEVINYLLKDNTKLKVKSIKK